MKKAAIVALLLVVLALAWRFYTSPQYSLHAIQTAVRDHDVTAFEELVDIDGVIARLLGELPGHLAGNEGMKVLGQEASQVIQEFAKDTVGRAAKTALKTFIERGHLDSALTDTGVLSKITKDARLESLGFAGLKEVLREGSICRVTIEVHVGSYDGDTDVTFMMRDKGSYWQLAELTDVPALLGRIEDLRIAYRYKDLSAAALYLLELNEATDGYADSRTYTALARAAVNDGRIDDANRFLKSVLTACALMTASSWSFIRADCIADAAAVYFESGERDKGRELVRSVEVRSRDVAASSMVRTIAVDLVAQGRVEEALAEIATIPSPLSRLRGLLAVADLLDGAASSPKKRELLQRATDSLETIADASLRAELFGAVARLQASTDAQTSVVEDLFAVAAENVNVIADARLRAKARLALSRNLLDTGRREAAEGVVRQAIVGLKALKDEVIDTNAALVEAAVILFRLGRTEEAESIVGSLPRQESKADYRRALLGNMIESGKHAEVFLSASPEELATVAALLAQAGKTDSALDAAGRMTDRKRQRGVLLTIANAELSTPRRSGKRPEIAKAIMTMATSK